MTNHNDLKLRQAWQSQLKREYDDICWRYRVRLNKPFIEISDSQSCWGTWNAANRTLKISSLLIRGYPWDVVLAILKHEMAHQITTDIFKCREKHGDEFNRACAMIGVPDEFISAGGDIPRTLNGSQDDEIQSASRSILEKVRKLLSLAGSTNEHEAALAMEKANEFIERYNLDRLEREEQSRYIHKIIELKRKRIENYHKRICSILMDFFYVDIVLSDQYDASDDQIYRTIDIMGTVENVVIADYVYGFLMNQLEFLWRIYRKKSGKSGKDKRSYWLGLLKGFRDKLEQQEKNRSKVARSSKGAIPLTSSLVVSKDQGLIHFKRRRYPRLVHRRNAAATVDMSVFQAGINDGRQLTLHHGLTEHDGNRGRLITGNDS